MAVVFRLLAFVTTLLVVSCAAPGGLSPGAGGISASLLVSGPQVFVNGRPARSGMPITSGDSIRTGANSSALVRWSEGTSVQIDQNSDPLFIWSEGVLYVNCGYGWFLFDTGRMRVRVENELSEVLIGSRAALRIVPGQSFDAFLLDGRLDLLRPPGRPLMPNEKVLIGPQGILAYAPIQPAERLAIERRFERWQFAAAPAEAPPWFGEVLGIAVGGLLRGSDEPESDERFTIDPPATIDPPPPSDQVMAPRDAFQVPRVPLQDLRVVPALPPVVPAPAPVVAPPPPRVQ